MKKDYEKPTMKVVKLQQRTMLLSGSAQSTMSARRSSYVTAGEEETWE